MNRKNNFLKYINTPISREGTIILFDANNIKYEKCELYNDFVQSLLMIVFDTYLGGELTNFEQQKEHFKWCWSKNVSNFKKEGIVFNNNKLYDYFLEFTLEVYYSSSNTNCSENIDNGLLKLWENIFNYNSVKTNSDIDTLVEIYQLMEKNT